MQKKIRVFEAFSGYGSQSIALRNLGLPYEVVAISEIDKYAIQAYKAIHGEVNNLGDISKINSKDIPQHDLFTYSFPCQDISLAGKQASFEEGSGTRSSLLWECKKIIESCRPKYLLMENVKNLISKKHKPNFDKWLLYLESLGYTNYWQILNSKDYGIPQSRERIFVISILDEHKPYKFPDKLTLEKNIFDFLESNIPDKYKMSSKCIEKIKRFQPKNIPNEQLINPIAPTLTTADRRYTGRPLGRDFRVQLAVAGDDQRFHVTPLLDFKRPLWACRCDARIAAQRPNRRNGGKSRQGKRTGDHLVQAGQA